MSALVELLDVSLCDFDSEQLHGRGIDTPVTGDVSETYALDVKGWVLGRRPVAMVRLVHDGKALWGAPLDPRVNRTDVAAAFPDIAEAAASGFQTAIGTLRLPPGFELLIRARLDDDSIADVATIRGSRKRLRIAEEPRIQPLVLTAFGRSGTTAVTRMLESHPRVVAYDTFHREPGVAGYWMGVLTALAEPHSYRHQIMPGSPTGNWWLGDERFLPPYDEDVQRLIGAEGVEALATFCESRIAAFYGRLAGERSGSAVRYFVEKYMPGSLPEVLWDVYPGAREVILVRDFRDMAASMIAFSARRDRQFFGRHRVKTDLEFIQRMGSGVANLVTRRQKRGTSAFLLRYEDVVRRPDEVMPELLDFLGLETSTEILNALREGFGLRTAKTDAHRTIGDVEASIGRWQQDLDDELKAACEEAFGPALEAFGYA